MKRFFLLVVLSLLLAGCGEAVAPPPVPTHQSMSLTYTTESPATPIPLKPTQAPTATPTVLPTRQATNPVCNEKATNTPCVKYASVQDAAAGSSNVGSVVHTRINNGIVLVEDDITNVKPSVFGPATTLDAIQLQCFTIQEELWYALKSTTNPDASQTIRKSDFREVDITFTDQHKGNGPFASCRLTSSGVGKIDKAGMWTDSDYVGAWALYDGTTFS
jgi:hypothetical protein